MINHGERKHAWIKELVTQNPPVSPIYRLLPATRTYNDKVEEQAYNDVRRKWEETISVLKDDLNLGGEITGRLIRLEWEEIYVPDCQPEGRCIYSEFLDDVLSFMGEETGLRNPIENVAFPEGNNPAIPENVHTALVVNNHGVRYCAVFEFIDRKGRSKKVSYESHFLSGKPGQKSVSVSKGEDGKVRIRESCYCVINKLPANILYLPAAPMEEAVHMALGRHTMAKAMSELKGGGGFLEIKSVLDRLISIEEALAGGIVHSLVPAFMEMYVGPVSESLDRIIKAGKNQYALREKGVQAVEKIGLKEAVRIYKNSIDDFSKLLE